MNIESILQITLNGVLTGGVYSLIALGLTLIFGVMRVVNFAHGEMLVLGMYTAYTILVWSGIDPFFSLPLGGCVLFIIGYLVQKTLINRIIGLSDAMQFVPMVGLALILQNLTRLIWGPDQISPESKFSLSSFHIGEIGFDVPRLLAFALAAIIAILIFLFLKYTDTGKSIRASGDNLLGASLVGIDVKRIYATCFGIGAACVGISGTLLVPLVPLSPHEGTHYTLLSFVIIILGGMGSLIGAIAGGLIIGITEALSTLVLPSSLKQVVSYSLMILILLIRPTGLFGKS
jgi:branched-chain amino acid transport system permease protein